MTGTTTLDPVVRFLAAGLFVMALGFGIITPVLPLLAQGFGVGTAAITLVVSVFAGARLACGLVAGPVVRRFGARRIYGVGVLVVGVCTGMCAFAAVYSQLLVFRGLAGIGSTLFTVAAAVLIAEFTPPDQRGRAAGLMTAAGMLGRICGPVAGGVLAQAGVRVPLLVYAGLMAAVAVISVAALRGLEPGSGDRVEQGGPSMSDALRHPTYRAALAANFAVDGWAAAALQTGIMPLYVAEVVPGSPVLVGVTLSAFAVGTLAALPLAGRLADTRGRKPLALIGIAVTAAGTVVLGFAGTAVVLVAASFAVGAGAGLLTPPMSAAVTDIANLAGTGGGRGTVLSGYQMAGDVGAMLGPVAIGFLVTLLSYRDGFLVTAAVVVVAGLAWLGARETAPAR